MKIQRPRNPLLKQKRFSEYDYSKVVNKHDKSFKSSRPENNIARHKRKPVFGFITRSLLLIIFLFVIYMATTVKNIDIAIIEEGPNNTASVKNDSGQQMSDYLGWFEKRLNSKIWGKNILFMNEAEMLEDFTADNLLVKSASFGFNYASGSLKVNVQPREPMARYSTSDKILILDNEGFAFSDNANNYNNLPLIKDEAQFGGILGKQAIDTNTALYINQFSSLSSERSLNVEYFVIPQAIREVYIKFSSNKYIIKTHMDMGPEASLNAYEKALGYVASSGINVSEYIDLRVEGKAIYK
ncbi:hypothetical protein DYH10_04130 [Candidatus Saccharibacteria bacterium CPR2]|nr:hypothetical protein [Candidatus Saccharibacteria bacterium CPR2]